MAIDSIRKRKSIAAGCLPWMGPTVHPDGSFNEIDRAVIAYTYSGIGIGVFGAIGALIVRSWIVPSLRVMTDIVPSLRVSSTIRPSIPVDTDIKP